MGTPANEAFDQIVERAEIDEIRAVSLSASSAKGEALASADVAIDLKDRTRWTLSDDRAALTAFVDFELRISNDRDAEAEFRAAITYAVKYLFESPIPDSEESSEALRRFAENNARFNAWPFLREYVNYASSYMGLPSVMIPLLKPYARARRKARSKSSGRENEAIR